MSYHKKNICFLLGSVNGMGGTGRAVSILAKELQYTNKYNISLLCYYNKDLKSGYEVDDKVVINSILNKPMSMRKAFLIVLINLVKYLREKKIDSVIACGALYFPVAIIAARFVGCKIICSDHSNYTNTIDAKFGRQARNFAARYSNVLITLTKKDMENYKKNTKVKANIDFIHNIVDERLFNSKYNYIKDSKKIISVGRLTYAKNYELLINIAAEILQNYPEWSWDIYGSGELYDSLSKKINDKKVERLNLKGAASNIYDIYHRYAFLVMTSRYEGYPMVLLESIANKVPVIAFDCQTGPSDIIDHNKTGLLVEENNVAQMIHSIELLIVDESFRVTLSNNCELAIKSFSTSDILNIWNMYL